MSKASKMVFAAFTQHCIQSTVTHLTHVKDVEDAKYYCALYTGPLTPPGGRLFRSIWTFYPVGLVVHHQTVQGGSFVNFLGLDNYKSDCTQDAQPILKTKGCSATQ